MVGRETLLAYGRGGHRGQRGTGRRLFHEKVTDDVKLNQHTHSRKPTMELDAIEFLTRFRYGERVRVIQSPCAYDHSFAGRVGVFVGYSFGPCCEACNEDAHLKIVFDRCWTSRLGACCEQIHLGPVRLHRESLTRLLPDRTPARPNLESPASANPETENRRKTPRFKIPGFGPKLSPA
jgi:hypothetical protein